MNIEEKTKKQLQQYIRTYNQKELIKLKNIVKSCSNERYQKVSEELNEKLPKILDIKRKKKNIFRIRWGWNNCRWERIGQSKIISSIL